MTSSNPVVRPAPRISPRLTHAQALENAIHLNAHPETHGPFPGMISPCADADGVDRTSVSTYEVRYTNGSSHDVVAGHVQVDIEGGFVMMTHEGAVVLMAPMNTLLYIKRHLEE